MDGKIEFKYSFIESEQAEEITLMFTFKVKQVPKNSKTTINYVTTSTSAQQPSFYDEIKVVEPKSNQEDDECVCKYDNEFKEDSDIDNEENSLTNDATVNKTQNNELLYCSLGLSSILLISFVVVLMKYLKLKKQ